MLKDKYNVYYELIREEREKEKRQVQVSKMAPSNADSVFEHAKGKIPQDGRRKRGFFIRYFVFILKFD